MTIPFQYGELLPLGKEQTPFGLLTKDYVTTTTFQGGPMVLLDPAGLTLLANTAMRDIAHLLRPGHLQQLRNILDDDEATENDRYVAFELLKNANIAAGMVLPSCQDTGTATIIGKKGEQIYTGGGDRAALSHGVYRAYSENNLRYSMVAPLSMYEEKNTGTNLPAQIDIEAVEGAAYKFLFMAKGGGSANKTFLFQQTKALLNPSTLLAFLREKIQALGTSACPPYHLAIVIGGTSPEMVLKTAKLASARYLDTLPTGGDALGRGFRDLALEADILAITRQLGLGAQFGGKYFVHDVRVIRLPRHGASCPVGMALSCSADRNILARVDHEGIWLEELERDPARFLPEVEPVSNAPVVHLDLNQPMDKIRADLSRYPVRTRVMLTGPIIVARDIAHAKIKERLERGEGMPNYFRDHIVYYAGPAKTPTGLASGSFGPTTAGRMDSYVDLFQKNGGSYVTLAKGNRGLEVTKACHSNGGFYLGSIGGGAARLAQCIHKVEVLDYPELGMEAVHRIEVVDFPAFIIVDDKGNDFFAQLAH